MLVVCIAGCKLTPGLQPLVCTCGKHSARLQAAGEEKRKWEIFEVKKEGNKPCRVSMRVEKLDTLFIVVDLCKYAKGCTRRRTSQQRHRKALVTCVVEAPSSNINYNDTELRAPPALLWPWRVLPTCNSHNWSRVMHIADDLLKEFTTK